MRVLITGARGLVGSALVRHFRDDDVIALGHGELDVTNESSVERTLDRVRPDVIFNCAVAGVDECERDRALAMRLNAEAPRFLARSGTTLVHFSTNYVFDGERTPDHSYAVTDTAHPVNVYGHSKLAGEKAVLAAKGIVVRTSWVYGPGKDNFLSTAAHKLRRGERIKAITDTWASTTYVEDLVARVRQLVDESAYGLHHVANDGACTYETFALECARLTGADPSLIDRVTESEMNRPAARPRVTPLRCEPPLRPWPEALAEYVSR